MGIEITAGDDTESNYGSELDEDGEDQLRQLLDAVEVCDPPLENLQDDARPAFLHIPAFSNLQRCKIVEPPKVNPDSGNLSHDESTRRIQREIEDPRRNPDDCRTPLDRFRTAPNKSFSVTDFVSPAWCELQYWYHLVKYGKVKRTPAMKRGSEVHKVLEDQVHQTVPVDVQTREDRWGLRIWNVIQGLRTLKATGTTRELEIWGTIDGETVIGIIDELSFTCPDPELEHSIEKPDHTGERQTLTSSHQMTISQFLGGAPTTDSKDLAAGPIKDERKIYLTDVKSRGSRILPNKIGMRPTEIQLMLYRCLLADMACNSVDCNILFARYNLKPAENFSDSMISQLSALDSRSQTQTMEDFHTPLEHNTDIATELLTHNSLSELWSLMLSEFQKTMPYGAESISPVLRAEFRSSTDGSIIGAKTFLYRHEMIMDHVTDEMRWWKGEREARGVDVEEAFKCRICPFAEKCTWRLSKIEDAVSASRKRLFAQRSEDEQKDETEKKN